MRHWYANLDKKNLFATSVGLVALCGLIAALILPFVPPSGRLEVLTLCYVIVVPGTLYYWIGKGAAELGFDSWIDWLGLFLIGSLMFVLLMWIDCGWRNLFGEEIVSYQPGLSFAFNLAVLLVTVVALPGALRAWLLNR